MNNVVHASFAIVLNILLPLGLQAWDRRRHGDTFRSNWSIATWGASLYAFGTLSMLGWMWVTRPRWRRVFLGWLSCFCLNLTILLFNTSLLWIRNKPFTLEDQLTTLMLGSSIMLLTLFMEVCVSLLGYLGVGRWAR